MNVVRQFFITKRMGHTTDGMPQNLYKDTAFWEGENKHKKKCPFPQKKAKTIPKHHFRKLHLSTPSLPGGMKIE